jgi:hypothetical protein
VKGEGLGGRSSYIEEAAGNVREPKREGAPVSTSIQQNVGSDLELMWVPVVGTTGIWYSFGMTFIMDFCQRGLWL